jgi:PAS domain S-box-containing protein
MRNELLIQAEMVTQAINVEKVKTLSGTGQDLENPDYLRLKEQLAKIVTANEKCHFIYLMSQMPDGSVIFLVDNEPPDSEDYSAPGDQFNDATDELISVFEKGRSLVEGPVKDQWGVWVSAIVPIRDSQDGAVIALLGIDYDATTWRRDLLARAALPIGMTMSTFLLLSLLVIMLHNRSLIQRSRIEMHELKVFNETIVQNADEGIIVTDKSGKVTFANPALEKMLGYNPGEMDDQSWLNFVPPAMRDIAVKADQTRAKGQSERYELQLQHKNGTPVPVQISASPRYDQQTGAFSGSQAVMTNITNIQQAEKAIRESEEKYRLIFERSPFGVLHFDSKGSLLIAMTNLSRLSAHHVKLCLVWI